MDELYDSILRFVVDANARSVYNEITLRACPNDDITVNQMHVLIIELDRKIIGFPRDSYLDMLREIRQDDRCMRLCTEIRKMTKCLRRIVENHAPVPDDTKMDGSSAENTPEVDKIPDLAPAPPVVIRDPVVAAAYERYFIWCEENNKIIREWEKKEIRGQRSAFPKYAAAHVMINVLEDFVQFAVLPEDLYQTAIYFDQLAVLEWLYDRQLFDIDTAEHYAAAHGKLEALKYLISKRRTTSNFDHICEHAASAGQIAVLQMIAIRHAWPIKWDHIRNIAAKNNQHELVAWIDQVRG